MLSDCYHWRCYLKNHSVYILPGKKSLSEHRVSVAGERSDGRLARRKTSREKENKVYSDGSGLIQILMLQHHKYIFYLIAVRPANWHLEKKKHCFYSPFKWMYTVNVLLVTFSTGQSDFCTTTGASWQLTAAPSLRWVATHNWTPPEGTAFFPCYDQMTVLKGPLCKI